MEYKDDSVTAGFYTDDSVTAGFYVSDVFHLDTNGSTSTDFSTSLIFGCCNERSGALDTDNEVDGILALGPRRPSLNSQLSSPTFSYCLNGGETGGGVLVLAKILDPKIMYIDLDISEGSYNVNLQSIALNGKIIQIDPKVFEPKNGGQAVVDSGSSLLALGVHLYSPFMSSMIHIASAFARPVSYEGFQCFEVSRRMHHKFPVVSFNFHGGVSMTVKPKDYLIWWSDRDNVKVWCLGIKEPPNENVTHTILGEVILQDKIIVYDLEHKRLGWASHDCAKPFYISSDMSASRSMIEGLLTSTITSSLTLFLYLFVFG